MLVDVPARSKSGAILPSLAVKPERTGHLPPYMTTHVMTAESKAKLDSGRFDPMADVTYTVEHWVLQWEERWDPFPTRRVATAYYERLT